ncbi:MAG: hypothetical protein A2046_17110 [Bacteroidetes bacterium GWA2_30_7]|nr:MAG: hypothetical protein A2046_17110 [Bacteroidetes bacterium GWA2_30_7]
MAMYKNKYLDNEKLLSLIEAKLSVYNDVNQVSFLKLGNSIINKIDKILSINNINNNEFIKTEEIINSILQDIFIYEFNYKECYLKVLDNFPALIWCSGIDSKFSFFNKSWLKFRGRTMNEEIGDGWKNGIHKDDLNVYIKKYLEAFNNRVPFTIEYRLQRYDGKYFNIIDYGRPFYNGKENFTGYVGSCYNITENIENEKKLNKSNEELNKLLTAIQQSANLIVITNLSGDIEFVNKKFTETTGYTYDEAIGKNIKILKSNYYKPDFYENLWKTISNGKVWTGEFFNKKKNGEFYWEKAVISPVFNNNNEIINYIAVKEDITEKKIIENKLIEQEELFNKITNSAHDAIVVIDKEGDIVFWNKMAVNIFEYSSDEVIGKKFYKMLTPKKCHKIYETVFSNFKKPENDSSIGNTLEFLALNKSGKELRVELSLSSVFIKEKFHTIGIIRDVTERKKILNNLKKLNNTKNQLISIIGHDLRSSFLTINGFSKLLIDRVEKLSKDEISKMSSTIYNTSIFGQRLLENIIQWAKSQSNNINIELKELKIESLINDIIAINKINIEAKKIKIETKIPKSLTLISDRNIISTVLLNIISNAIKYSLDNSNIKINVTQKQDSVIITITDFGIGISINILNKINKNQNIISTLGTHNEKGTGMGLMLCTSLIEKINGSIIINSKKNSGTKIQIIIPIPV